MKKKKTTIFLFILLILLGAAAFCFYYMPAIHFKEKPVLEKGMVYPVMDYVEEVKGEMLLEEEELDSSEVGEHVLQIRVKNGPFERDFPFAYEVVDTIPPEITIGENMVILEPGEVYDEDRIRENVSVNEGTYEYYTDYDPEFPGVYLFEIRAADESGNRSKASFHVSIRDDVPPMVLNDGSGTTILRSEKFNINDHIAYGDNVDANVKLVVEGRVRTARAGTYPLNVTLRDESGNETKWSFDVKVVTKMPKPDDEEDYDYLFADFVKDHQGEGRSFGIDVSTWQGAVDYEAVKAAGCEFVIIRIGYSSKGQFRLDDEYLRSIAKAKEAGLKVGVYLFSYDSNEIELLSSLDQVMDILGDTKLDLPFAFDWEDFMDFQDYGMSFKDLNHLYDVFSEIVSAKGYEPMLYGSKYYLNNIWTQKDTRKVWLAQYSNTPTYDYPYSFWQASDHGVIDGIDGHVDFNVFYQNDVHE